MTVCGFGSIATLNETLYMVLSRLAIELDVKMPYQYMRISVQTGGKCLPSVYDRNFIILDKELERRLAGRTFRMRAMINLNNTRKLVSRLC